eukprot:209524_1
MSRVHPNQFSIASTKSTISSSNSVQINWIQCRLMEFHPEISLAPYHMLYFQVCFLGTPNPKRVQGYILRVLTMNNESSQWIHIERHLLYFRVYLMFKSINKWLSSS